MIGLTASFLALVILFSIGMSSLAVTAESEETASPYAQLRHGTPIDQIKCSGEKVLLQKDGRPACVTGATSDKLKDRGWSVVLQAAEPGPVRDEEHETESATDQREEYLSSLSFGLVGEGDFTGEMYGFDQHVLIRQPAPNAMFFTYGGSYYSFNETSLAGRQNLDDVIPLPSGGNGTAEAGARGAGGNGTDTTASDAAIDYREWLPTWIAPGYYLKWVHITQPEQQWAIGYEGRGAMVIYYMPKGLEVPDDITDKEFVDLNYYLVTIVIAPPPYELPLYTDEDIASITRNGTATDIVYVKIPEGYYEYVYASRADPTKHSVAYDTPHISIGSGGTALTMQEHENIVNELLERYSKR